MARFEVQLPTLLAPVIASALHFELEAETVRDAFDRLRQDHADIARHLFDENHQLRPHVLCFHNGTNTRWLDDLGIIMSAGDTLLFMQAVTGG